MTELEKIELRYGVSKRKRHAERLLAKSSKSPNRIAAGFAAERDRGDLDKGVIELVLAASDKYGLVRGTRRLQLHTMARKLVSLSLAGSADEWLVPMAEAAAHRINRGIHEPTVLDGLAAAWERLGGDASAEARAALEAAVKERVNKLQTERPKRPRKASRYVDSNIDRGVDSTLGKSLGADTDFEAIQRRDATVQLRHALCTVRPWARRVVADKLVKRLSYRELAAAHDLRVRDVEDILKETREHCLRYTSYFDDDWYWADKPTEEEVQSPKATGQSK